MSEDTDGLDVTMDTGCIHLRSGGPSTIPKGCLLRLFLLAAYSKRRAMGCSKQATTVPSTSMTYILPTGH